MSELQVFNNAEFGSVRSLMVNGEPYFVGRDVAKILGYANPNDAIAKRVDEEDKGVAKCDTLGGIQELTVINESGLYSLILSSKLPSAKRFKRWVTSEVLPAIRKHGVFVMDDIVNNTDALIEALQAFKAERLQRMALEEENAVQKQQLVEMKGLQDFLKTVKKIKSRINEKLDVAGILLTMCDARTILCKTITEQVTETFNGQIRIFKSKIPSTVKVGESVYYSEPLTEYAPGCNACKAYEKLAGEVIADEG